MNFKNIIKNVAPFIGTLIGGPMGGIATKILGDVFCGNEKATEKEIEKAVANASPEDFIKLKQVNAETERKYIEAGVDLEKIAAGDRDSARKMQMDTNSIMPAILSLFLTLGFFSILFSIMFFKMQDGARDIIDIMLGSLGTAWTGCIMYWFGSSVSSKIKTMMLKKS